MSLDLPKCAGSSLSLSCVRRASVQSAVFLSRRGRGRDVRGMYTPCEHISLLIFLILEVFVFVTIVKVLILLFQ